MIQDYLIKIIDIIIEQKTIIESLERSQKYIFAKMTEYVYVAFVLL